MNEINIDPSRILAAKLLSPEKASYQLFQLSPVTFTVYDRLNDKIVIAFASSALAECFLDIGHVKIKEVCYRRHEDIASAQPTAKTSLLFVCSDSKNIVLDSFDHVWIQEYFSTHEKNDHALWSPHKLWGCSPFKHFDLMLLTDRLAQTIETIADEGQQLHLAHILWKELELSIHPTKLGDTIEIDGEFTSFKVSRHLKVLFVFDLLSDAQTTDQEYHELDDEDPVF